MNVSEGALIENTSHPEWGPGKIVHVSGDKAHIVFRDLEEEMARLFPANSPMLRAAASQTDPILDNLPPLKEKGGRWVLPSKRLSLESLSRKFLHEFPASFSDPKYFAEERDYKLAAHVRFQEILGLEHARDLLKEGQFRSLATKALQVLGAVNLLSPYESAAFHDAMQDDHAVRTFFLSLLKLLDTAPLNSDVFDKYAEAVTSLPAEGSRVATWPVATVFPYLADPDRLMFLKPDVTEAAADSLGFDLRYNSTPNWTTYEALLRMGTVYLDLLRPAGARDFLDVQSFIYVTCGGYDNARAKAKAKKQSARAGQP
jgi:hypothetical protein